MFRGSNSVKRQQWVERLERFRKSGKTVAEFCRAEMVKTPTFYQWKRKLGSSTTAKSSNHGRPRVKSKRPANSPAFKPVRITTTKLSVGANVRLPDGWDRDRPGQMGRRTVPAIARPSCGRFFTKFWECTPRCVPCPFLRRRRQSH